MKLSTRSRYGTRLMLELAKHFEHRPVSLPEISKNQDIPKKYLEQITIPLKKAHYVKSIRGVYGGYVLTKPPVEITLDDIVAVLEGNRCVVKCMTKDESCRRFDECVIRTVWEKGAEAMFNYLASISLTDLLEMERR